jgi:hypothetical protein
LGFVDTDTGYNRVMVFKGAESHTGRLMRVMATGPHAKQSAMYLDDPSALALPYTRYFRLVEHFVPEMRRLLVLGGGGFSFPKYALANYPNVSVDVVELDPGIVALARDYFELKDHPRQNIILAAFASSQEIRQTGMDADISAMLAKRVSVRASAEFPVMTDEYAPVDRYIMPAW